MNLCIDIGNTRVKWSVFDLTGQIAAQGIRKRLTLPRLRKWVKKHQITRLIISSVRRHKKRWKRRLDRHFADRVIFLDRATPLPIQLRYATPDTLGRDRIASAVGARSLFPDTDLLVIDAGTCTTLNLIDAAGNYWGGNITPGLSMRFAALHLLTARLPHIAADPDARELVGDSTETSIRCGVQWGVVHEIDGFIEHYRSLFPTLRVVMTGGNASYFETRLKNQIFVVPNLVPIGLYQILLYNVPKTTTPSLD